jgi:hypothetical protein
MLVKSSTADLVRWSPCCPSKSVSSASVLGLGLPSSSTISTGPLPRRYSSSLRGFRPQQQAEPVPFAPDSGYRRMERYGDRVPQLDRHESLDDA